jgi:hypothetical protein
MPLVVLAWTGEADGLRVSLAAAEAELAHMTSGQRILMLAASLAAEHPVDPS